MGNSNSIGRSTAESTRLRDLEGLFSEWRKLECGEEPQDFIEDGMLDPDGWDQADTAKVLFVLKEPNASIDEELRLDQKRQLDKRLYTEAQRTTMAQQRWLRLRCLIKAYQRVGLDGPLGGSFRHLQKLAYGLQRATPEKFPTFYESNEYRCQAAAGVAFMNLQKTPGGGRESPQYKEFARKVRKSNRSDLKTITTKEFIRREVKELLTFEQMRSRRAIVCCGTLDVLQDILEMRPSASGGVFHTTWEELPNIPVVSTHHPNRAGEPHYIALLCQYQRCLGSAEAIRTR